MRLILGAVLALAFGAAAAMADDPAVPPLVEENCVACHGETGNAVDPQYPSLAGQPAAYLSAQLQAFRDGSRASDTMATIAEPLSDGEIATLAAYFAAQHAAPPAAPVTADTATLRRGAWFFTARGRGNPPCAACHDPEGFRAMMGGRGMGMGQGMGGGMGRGPMMTDPALTPRLYGQPATYLADQLDAFASGARRNSTMGPIAARLAPADRKALAAYLSQQR